MQKQKGKTATMVSGNRKKCGQTGYSAAAQAPMNASQPIRGGKKGQELWMHKKPGKKKSVWVMSIGRNRL